MRTEDLTIEGMTCGHCVMSVRKELSKLTGVQLEFVEIGRARLRYDDSRISQQDLEWAIDNAGYRLVPNESPNNEREGKRG